MHKTLGFSAYVTTFEEQKTMLRTAKSNNALVFSSFHIAEEVGEDYILKTTEMCKWLKNHGFKIIGDVSCRTAKTFGCKDVLEFAEKLGVDILRLDYGFTEEETIEIAKKIPIAVNASTSNPNFLSSIINEGVKVYAMHNYYPRPETGLDEDILLATNKKLVSLGVEPLGFIPCDLGKRGPIYEGLPTLESHRDIPPYCSFVDLAENYSMSNIFAGDLLMSHKQLQLIDDYIATGVISLPITLNEKYTQQYGKKYTIRIDSPSCAFRLVESREYSHPGALKEPYNCNERFAGCITIDNLGYKRYSGELMIIRKDLPSDPRVNVIGTIQKEYMSLLSAIKVGRKIKFIPSI